MEPPPLTLACGPVALAPAVQAALLRPILHHLDPDFRRFYAGLGAKLAQALAVPSAPAILQMEAMGALEAAMASLVRPHDTVLTVVTGPYGAWLDDLARRLTGGRTIRVEPPVERLAALPEAIAASLADDPSPALVTLVHVETPLGLRLPVPEIAAAIHQTSDALLLVDAVAGWPGEPLDPVGWGLDLVVLGAQKCLGSTPGITPIWLSERARARVAGHPLTGSGSMLAIGDWLDLGEPGRAFPFTPSIADLYALDAALELLLAEGAQACAARHARTARACRAAMTEFGLDLVGSRDEERAHTVTAVHLPGGIDGRRLRAMSRARLGVEFAGGYGADETRLLRIGHMAETARPLPLLAGVAALGDALGALGRPARTGAAIEAALRALTEP